MKKTFYVWFMLGIGLHAIDADAQRFSDEHRLPRANGWVFDYDEARATARRTNRPLMVVFRCVP